MLKYKNPFYIDINKTYEMIIEADNQINNSIDDKILNLNKTKTKINNNLNNIIIPKLISCDSLSRHNKFFRPRGVVISDSYNNLFFPIKHPILDTSKFDLPILFHEFKHTYGSYNLNFLPWHYVIDFIQNQYYVFNTRPIDQIFPLNNNDLIQISKNTEKLSDSTKKFIEILPFEIQKSIHVLIIGDSNYDIYTKKFYQVLASIAVTPILELGGLPKEIGLRIFCFNLFSKFSESIFSTYIKAK